MRLPVVDPFFTVQVKVGTVERPVRCAALGWPETWAPGLLTAPVVTAEVRDGRLVLIVVGQDPDWHNHGDRWADVLEAVYGSGCLASIVHQDGQVTVEIHDPEPVGLWASKVMTQGPLVQWVDLVAVPLVAHD